jgi:hypothetical protein
MPVKSRSYFSIPYLCGAARYAREAFSLEAKSALSNEDALVHRAYVVSAITSSATALEAMINEAFADAAESEGSCVAALPSDARAKLATLWSIPRTSRYAILDKFDVAHLLVTGRGLDRSHHRWRNASWVVRLRNDFVHFEPSWQEHGGTADEDMGKIERALGGLFPENPLTAAANPFYPDRLLGYGCAAWSISSALEFADNFWQSIAVMPPYQAHRHFFATQ